MKHYLLAILLILTFSGFTQNAEKKKINQLMTEMMNDDLELKLSDYLSPTYIKSNNLSQETHQLNAYAPVGYKIIDKEKGLFKVKIWGDNHIWIHELFFKVIKENGDYYFQPSGIVSVYYVNPWVRVNSNIENKTKSGSKNIATHVEKNEQFQFVKQFLTQMKERTVSMYVSDYVQSRQMKKFKVKDNEHRINTYAPQDFSIIKNENGVVVAQIWGVDHAWTHEITFKLIRKKNRFYFPIKEVGTHKYVTIWDDVKQNIKVSE